MRYEELSSMNGSPKLKPNPHLDLDVLQKEAIAYQKKNFKQELARNLRDRDQLEDDGYNKFNPRSDSILYDLPLNSKKNETSVASSSTPDFIDAT